MEEDRKYALSILYMNNENRCFQTIMILIEKQKTGCLQLPPQSEALPQP